MDDIKSKVDKLLNQLINIYERRILKNPDEFNRNIFINITKKTIPEYFNESSSEFQDINLILKQLEAKGLISIVWKNNIKDHIISRIKLNTDNITDLYIELNRVPVTQKINNLNERILELSQKYNQSSLVGAYFKEIETRVDENLSIKSLVDIDNLSKLDQTAYFLFIIDNNRDECFIREFSVKHFNDSKFFEKNQKRIISLIKHYRPDLKDRNEQEVLEEFNIYTNPVYLRIKGSGVFQIGKENLIKLDKLAEGIAIASSDLEQLKLIDSSKINSVITVENLTSYFRINQDNTLIIYIGGFHNKIHRDFLNYLAEIIPSNKFFHFGDIDVGGFLILLDLIKKTNIHFKPYLMGVDTINKYEEFSTDLTQNDVKRFNDLLKALDEGEYNEYLSKAEQSYFISLFRSLINKNRKLEQEALYWSI